MRFAGSDRVFETELMDPNHNMQVFLVFSEVPEERKPAMTYFR